MAFTSGEVQGTLAAQYEPAHDVTAGAPYGRPIWDNQTWTYSLTFDVDITLSNFADVSLVFDGVKMAADVSLNGKPLGTVADMFYRYRFPVASILLPANNVLSLSFFLSNDTANNEGRWTSCSGGWCVSYGAQGAGEARGFDQKGRPGFY